MIDIDALLRVEGPSEAAVEAEATRIAEAQVLVRTARGLVDDLNALMHALAMRGFESEVDAERQQIINAWCPYYAILNLTVRRVLR
jgi:hypothetical protein